jgi:hypothetical protein
MHKTIFKLAATPCMYPTCRRIKVEDFDVKIGGSGFAKDDVR